MDDEQQPPPRQFRRSYQARRWKTRWRTRRSDTPEIDQVPPPPVVVTVPDTGRRSFQSDPGNVRISIQSDQQNVRRSLPAEPQEIRLSIQSDQQNVRRSLPVEPQEIRLSIQGDQGRRSIQPEPGNVRISLQSDPGSTRRSFQSERRSINYPHRRSFGSGQTYRSYGSEAISTGPITLAIPEVPPAPVTEVVVEQDNFQLIPTAPPGLPPGAVFRNSTYYDNRASFSSGRSYGSDGSRGRKQRWFFLWPKTAKESEPPPPPPPRRTSSPPPPPPPPQSKPEANVQLLNVHCGGNGGCPMDKQFIAIQDLNKLPKTSVGKLLPRNNLQRVNIDGLEIAPLCQSPAPKCCTKPEVPCCSPDSGEVDIEIQIDREGKVVCGQGKVVSGGTGTGGEGKLSTGTNPVNDSGQQTLSTSTNETQTTQSQSQPQQQSMQAQCCPFPPPIPFCNPCPPGMCPVIMQPGQQSQSMNMSGQGQRYPPSALDNRPVTFNAVISHGSSPPPPPQQLGQGYQVTGPGTPVQAQIWTGVAGPPSVNQSLQRSPAPSSSSGSRFSNQQSLNLSQVCRQMDCGVPGYQMFNQCIPCGPSQPYMQPSSSLQGTRASSNASSQGGLENQQSLNLAQVCRPMDCGVPGYQMFNQCIPCGPSQPYMQPSSNIQGTRASSNASSQGVLERTTLESVNVPGSSDDVNKNNMTRQSEVSTGGIQQSPSADSKAPQKRKSSQEGVSETATATAASQAKEQKTHSHLFCRVCKKRKLCRHSKSSCDQKPVCCRYFCPYCEEEELEVECCSRPRLAAIEEEPCCEVVEEECIWNNPNLCPYCGVGVFVKKTTVTGYLTAILCFPCGLYCCLNKRICYIVQCTHCNSITSNDPIPRCKDKDLHRKRERQKKRFAWGSKNSCCYNEDGSNNNCCNSRHNNFYEN